MNIYALQRTGIPNGSLKLTLRLGKTLLRDIPEESTPTIDKTAGKLQNGVDEADEALTTRVREVNPLIIASEVQFDRGADVNWVWFRMLLEGWRDSGSHPGLSAMPEQLQIQCGLAHAREKAERARKLHERLFAAEGTTWVRGSFVNQAESSGALMRLIKADDLAEDVAFVCGPAFLPLLAGIQTHYENMVSERMRREEGPVDNFQILRAKLRWRIDRYKNAVETLLDDEEPHTFEIVAKALRSLTLLNERMAKIGASADDDLLGEGLVELEEPDGIEAKLEEAEKVQEAEAAEAAEEADDLDFLDDDLDQG